MIKYTRMRSSRLITLTAALVLAVATKVSSQRTSPQFSFPTATQNVGQFGADLFTSNGQDFNSLGQPAGGLNSAGVQSAFAQLGSSPLPPMIPEQPQLVAQSAPLAPQLSPVQPQQQVAQLQPQQQQQQQQQQQPQLQRPQEQPQSIQLSRPSLSLTSLTVPQSQPQQQTQTSSSRSSQLSIGQQIASSLAQPSSSSSLATSSQASTVSSSQSPSLASFSSSSSSSLSPSLANTNQHHQHQSNRHHQPQATGASSHRQSGSSSSSSPVQPARQSQHPANIQPQATSQSTRDPQSQQAAIEAARKSEATSASLAASSGQTYQCPDSFGYFRHHKSCDKYWACDNGTATLKLCGNGLMFDDSDPKRENCAYPFSVDCGADRTDLEPPISTPHCPRLYGLFADTTNCRVFYSCWNGESSKYECPPGLAYDHEQRVCVWADLVDRCDQSEVSDGFVCPDPTEADQPGHYTRHAHPTDCRKFYVCIDGVARPYGCSFGSVFNVDSLQCDEPENVSGCEKYYGDLDPKLAKKLARENAQQSGNVGPSSSASTTSQASRASNSA